MSYDIPSHSNRSDEGLPQNARTVNSKPKTKNSKLKIQNSKLCFVCVGAGQGSRFGGEKLAQALGGRTVFASALGALVTAIPAAPLVVVVAPERLQEWRDRLRPDFPEALFVGGGARRQDSVRAGVDAAIGLGAEVVAIHDAARPLVDPRDVLSVVNGLGEADGAILTARVSDTVKTDQRRRSRDRDPGPGEPPSGAHSSGLSGGFPTEGVGVRPAARASGRTSRSCSKTQECGFTAWSRVTRTRRSRRRRTSARSGPSRRWPGDPVADRPGHRCSQICKRGGR